MKTYIPPISGNHARPGEALLQEARTTGPAFVRSSRGSGRWHIVRSAVDRILPWNDDITTVFHLWCGSSAFSERALTAVAVPEGEPLCGTCYGRAEGADDRSDLIFEPQGHKPPRWCPGSQQEWVDESAWNRGICLACGSAVKLRGFGGPYRGGWGAQRHEPGPDLVDPCEFHGWRQPRRRPRRPRSHRLATHPPQPRPEGIPPMKPEYSTDGATIYHGDCLDVLRELPDNSVDAIVTDPPYGLGNTTPEQVAETIRRWMNGERDYLPGGTGFMGKAWDAFVPPVAVWDEALRVLKPGGHLLAFAGDRTYDLMTLGIRLGGFEIRQGIAWLYGSGFPKSLDVARAIDKLAKAEKDPDRLADEYRFTAWMRTTGITSRQIDEATGSCMGGHYLTAASQPAIPTGAMLDLLRPLLPEVPEWVEELVAERERVKAEAAERNADARFLQALELGNERPEITHEQACAWEGWGTALKPAFEPVVVARKPLVGTVAANVVEHGTGALNIDSCRIGDGHESQGERPAHEPSSAARYTDSGAVTLAATPGPRGGSPAGRWPANVVLDEHQAAELDQQSGILTSGSRKPGTYAGLGYMGSETAEFPGVDGDSGGASRFFYVAKADSSERVRVDGIAHPTVKPLDLMRWLVRLVTPPGGTVLEPFAGSGTTVEACLLEGFDCIAIERETEYHPLIRQRIDRRRDPVAAVLAQGGDGGLFDLLSEGEPA